MKCEYMERRTQKKVSDLKKGNREQDWKWKCESIEWDVEGQHKTRKSIFGQWEKNEKEHDERGWIFFRIVLCKQKTSLGSKESKHWVRDWNSIQSINYGLVVREFKHILQKSFHKTIDSQNSQWDWRRRSESVVWSIESEQWIDWTRITKSDILCVEILRNQEWNNCVVSQVVDLDLKGQGHWVRHWRERQIWQDCIFRVWLRKGKRVCDRSLFWWNEMTGNNFGDEGARALCDVIRANTTLNDLYIGSQLIPRVNYKQTIWTLSSMNRLWSWREWGESSERSMGGT